MSRHWLARAAAVALVAASSLGAAPVADANPVLLLEPQSGQVLFAQEPDQAWHPASIAKLMTAYLAFAAVKEGRIAWDADVPLSPYARVQPATRIGLRGGIKINLEQAVHGLILRSANDFAVAIAERIEATEGTFVQRMNQTARRLGMRRTHFRNPHGLPDHEQVTTARDMGLLAAALLRDFPERAGLFAAPSLLIHKGTFHNSNDLLRTFEGGDGLKTGFTCASGYNVVASATRNGRRLVAVVLGEYNRSTRSERARWLLEAGFAHIEGRAPPAESGIVGPLVPVALSDLPMAPAASPPPYDMSKETATRKCGNSSRVVRKREQGVATAAKGAPAAVAATGEKRAVPLRRSRAGATAAATPRPPRPVPKRSEPQVETGQGDER